LPTKSNNTGGRGGARPGAGRKKKSVSEKTQKADAEIKESKVIDIQEISVEMPKPHDFLSAKQKSNGKFQAMEIYEETWNWLKAVGCTTLISPQLLERYAMCAARWIQCEEMTSKLGYLSKHPTTGNPIPSPYINIGINYMNQANRLWSEIYQIVKENCSADHNGKNPQDDLMERLLRARKGS